MTITAAAAADMPSGNNEKKKNGAGGDSSSIRSRDFTIDPNSVQAFRARKAGLAAFKELVYLKGQSKLLRSRSAVSASERVKLLDWSDIRIVKMLGKGSFSEVYSAVLRTTADGPAPVSGGESEGAEGSASSSTGDDSVSISVDDSTKSTGNGLDKTGKDASTYVLLNDVGGSGGRGVGYVGDINDSDYPSTEYAVKCIRDDIINDVNTHEDGTFEQAAIDLVVEGHILSKVQHENIIRLYAIRRGDIRKAFIASPTSSSSSKETTPDRGYFLMLEVLNDTLADRLDKLKAAKKNGRLSPAQLWEASMTLVANSAVGVAKGLKHMHRLNVVLRDLKPDK
jgi:serine/threonine protein kinase